MMILFLFMLGVSNAAATSQWNIDTDHSGIYFDVGHIYSTVKGYFNEYEGKIEFDPEDLAKSRFEFVVKVKSIDTNNSKRDEHLLSADFFDADKYPHMTFKSTTVKHIEGNEYLVEGTMTIKDVSQTIELPFLYFGSKPSPFNPNIMVAGFETRMAVDRLAYHVGGGKFYDMAWSVRMLRC